MRRVARAPLFGCAIVGLVLAMSTPARAMVCVENATIDELRQALAAGNTRSTALVEAYLGRIEAYDRAGPRLNAVRELNPAALAIATSFDAKSPAEQGPLAGIPILVKDNIATADAMQTTAGSLALVGVKPPRDAALVTIPKFELVKLPVGLLNCPWLKKLKNSARNCTAIFSWILVVLWMPISVLTVPGPWKIR